MRDDWELTADATLGVVAHGLLNSVAVITGATRAILEGRTDDVERASSWLELVEEQAQLMAGVLKDLARGLPPDAMDELVRLGGGMAARRT